MAVRVTLADNIGGHILHRPYRCRPTVSLSGALRAACLAAALIAPHAFAQAPSYAVRIEGANALGPLLDKHLTINQRRAELTTQPERWRILLERTPQEARELLAAEGYLDARVTVATTGEPPADVVVSVELGEPVRVTEVQLRFRGAIADAAPSNGLTPNIAGARARWTLERGMRFRQEAWEQAKLAVLRELLAARFPTAHIVHANAEIDVATRAARLTVDYDSGPEFRFGALEVVGLSRYRSSVVEGLNTIRPGTPYSQRALAELQTRLYTVPYFSAVNVVTEPGTAADPSALPIRVEVTEADRYKIDLGGGYSTNTGLRVQGVYTDINLLERGWRWKSLARIEEREQRVQTNLTLPVRSSGWQDDYEAAFNRSDVLQFRVDSYTFNYKYAKTEGRIERALSMLATVSREFPAGTRIDTKQALVPGYAWRYRAFDNVLDPRSGYEFGTQVGVGAKAMLSDQNFVRSFTRAVGIIAMSPQDTVVVRAEGGVVFAPSRDGIPADLLFRAGGDQSLRGYRYQSIGVPEGQAIVGGRYLAIGGIEYIRWIDPQWGAAAFFEIGDAFDKRSALALKRGYGVGARWRSPVGPINFDLAYGEADKSVRVHFSIGYVF